MPQETKEIEDEEFNIQKIVNERAYKARITGYNRSRWFLIIKCKMSKAEVDNLTLDELMEAYYAAMVFAEEEEAAAKANANS